MITWAALAIGFLGSFHCIGMCGPIALSLPLKSPSYVKFTTGRILYNLGRVISYSLMGAVFGVFGKSISLWGYQRGLSIIIGVLIIIITLMPLKYRNRILGYSVIQKIITPLKIKITSLFKNGSVPSLFLIGILNGFLPCGFVYMGLAGAAATATPLSGAVFMAFFGLGTVPAMFVLSLTGKFFSLNLRQKISRLVPVFAILLAVIFILRGLSLGIPYVSPKMMHSTHQMEMMHGD